MAIHHQLGSLVPKYPLTAVVVISFTFLCTVVVFLREIFKPTGLRRTKDGRRSKLPPGPKGVPIFGNLLQLSKVRYEKEPKWVRAKPKGGQPDASRLIIL
jgi:hypothetical protein